MAVYKGILFWHHLCMWDGKKSGAHEVLLTTQTLQLSKPKQATTVDICRPDGSWRVINSTPRFSRGHSQNLLDLSGLNERSDGVGVMLC